MSDLARPEEQPAPDGDDRGDLVYEEQYAESMSAYTSAWPPGQLMEEYAAIDPDFPRMVLEELRAEREHRQKLEIEAQTKAFEHVGAEQARADRGQWMAFMLALVVLLGSFVMTAKGYDTAGITGIITALASLVIVFIAGRLLAEKEPAAEE